MVQSRNRLLKDAQALLVVPAYKVRGYLPECLDSILAQDYPDFEVVAVDDCSPDGSGAILDEYARRDPRIHVIHLTENVGLDGPATPGWRRREVSTSSSWTATTRCPTGR